jgi:hypothetical protein
MVNIYSIADGKYLNIADGKYLNLLIAVFILFTDGCEDSGLAISHKFSVLATINKLRIDS